MQDSISSLLERASITPETRSSKSAINELSRRFNMSFPEPLLRIWNQGLIEFDSLNAHVPSPHEVLSLIDDGVWGEKLLARGFVPVLNDHQSNFVAIIGRLPLAYRIAHLPHDDGSRLLFRDLNGLAKALLEAMETENDADCFLHETDGDYLPDTRRLVSDQEAAKVLLDTDGSNEEWNYAVQLLDESNLPEWSKLLETDHFVRRDALARMYQMKSPAIQDLLKQDHLRFEEFASQLANAAQAAGLSVGEQHRAAMRVEGIWINLEGFFHRRNIPNSFPRMIAWIEDLVAGSNPHDRPGHFMND